MSEGETLDGEGGYTVYGGLTRVSESARVGALPIGLAHGVRLTRAVPVDRVVTWNDVAAPIRRRCAFAARWIRWRCNPHSG